MIAAALPRFSRNWYLRMTGAMAIETSQDIDNKFQEKKIADEN
jgi:hypothetical protein